MRRTFLLIPHELAGVTVFGFGWLLVLLGIALALRLIFLKRSQQSVVDWIATEGLMWGLIAAAIVFLLPSVELKNVDGDPVGMAIRGYGVMLVIAVTASVALARNRAKKRGLDPEWIFSLAPWVLVGGIGGARLFYVIQYRETFMADSFAQTAMNMLKFTEGGLVVYGSFIGGFVATVVFVLRNKLSLLTLGDVIVPCMFLGLCIGRIGCLMNGCCYGGKCDDHWTAVRFPPGSMVYHDQLFDGSLIGVDFDPATRHVKSVASGSLADRAKIQPSQTVQRIAYDPPSADQAAKDIPAEDVRPGIMALVDDRIHRWTPAQLPDRALPVRPAQIISSLAAFGLCLFLCGLSTYPLRTGTVMLLGFAGYSVLRYSLEQIRVDESGQFGTSLSISQWVSVLVLVGSVFGLVWLYRMDGAESDGSRSE